MPLTARVNASFVILLCLNDILMRPEAGHTTSCEAASLKMRVFPSFLKTLFSSPKPLVATPFLSIKTIVKTKLSINQALLKHIVSISTAPSKKHRFHHRKPFAETLFVSTSVPAAQLRRLAWLQLGCRPASWTQRSALRRMLSPSNAASREGRANVPAG